MAGFTNLPSELIREIADYLMPEEIENFSLVLKRVFAVTLPILIEHRKLKKRYRAFENIGKAAFDGHRLENSDYWDDPVTSNCAPHDCFSDLLMEVLTDQRVALYVKEIRLEGWLYSWEPKIPDASKDWHQHVPYTEEQFFLFKNALSTYVLPEKLETWVRELESGNEDPIISLLLILLPRINSIKFEQCMASRHQLRKVVERVKTECKAGIRILGELQQMNFSYDHYPFDDNAESLDLLAFVATLPSLKSLYSQYVVSWGHPHDFGCLSPQSSNITNLGFKQCKLNLEQLKDLLQGLKALQKFSYIYEFTFGGDPWDPAGICVLLLQYARQSLEVLDLRGTADLIGPVDSLEDFEVLEELVLSFPLFQREADFPLKTLTSQLPTSIQKISLFEIGIGEVSSLRDTVREIVHFKSDRLPGLEKACFSVSRDLSFYVQFWDKLRKSCDDAGLELCILWKD